MCLTLKQEKIVEQSFPFLSLPEVRVGGLVTDREVKLWVVSDVITLHSWNSLLLPCWPSF